MKRFAMLLALVMVVVLLTGCCLKHDWEDATCTDPKICAKCGETEGEPLDHDWQDATCTDPKTCDRCGKTRGEPLSHEEGESSVEGSQMVSHCVHCGQELRRDATRREIADAQIVDHWVGYLLSNGDNTTNLLGRSDVYITFHPDGTLDCRLVDETYSGTWSYAEDSNNGSALYNVNMGSEYFKGCILVDDDSMIALQQGDYMLIFQRG